MMGNGERCLIVTLGQELKLLLARRCPEKAFTVNSSVFQDVGYGDFLGFYDWLRNDQHAVIGVRHHIFDEFKLPFDRFSDLPYAEVIKFQKIFTLSLYFGIDRNVEEESSDDQLFTDNRVYRSEHGVYAISFNVEGVVNSLSKEAFQKCQQIEGQ